MGNKDNGEFLISYSLFVTDTFIYCKVNLEEILSLWCILLCLEASLRAQENFGQE